MGIFCDYFTAASDADAAAVIDTDTGPAGIPEYRTVQSKEIEPFVKMGTLEGLLTGHPYDAVAAGGGSADIAIRNEGEVVVARLSDSLTEALANAADERLAEVAVPWSETEEFWGQGGPEMLAAFLRDLAALARVAREREQRVYCWVCV